MEEVTFRCDITSYDFPPNRVIIQHTDGTRCEFNYAFFEPDSINKDGCISQILKVYTEHNGNHWFYIEDLSYYYTEYELFPCSLFKKIKKIWQYFLSISNMV